MKQNAAILVLLPFLLFILLAVTGSPKAFSGDSHAVFAKNGYHVGLVGEFNFWGLFDNEDL
jgi:hypothetical protein